MPDLSREELWRQLKQDVIAPVYVLFGSESFLRDRAASEIIGRSFKDTDLREFNYDEISLNNRQGITPAIAAADQLPMMSTWRVVKVVDVRVAATSARDTLREDDEEILGRYLNNPSPSTVLIVVADELNGNRKLTKLLKKHSVTIEFRELDDAALTAWIRRTADDLNSRIDDYTVRLLIELIGADLRRLNNELEKLSTAAMPSGIISSELVEALVASSSEIENFALSDAIISGRGSRVLSAMKKVLDSGAEPVALLGLISYNIRRLLMAKDMMDRGEDRRRVADILKMRYRDQEDFIAAARRVDRKKLVRIFDQLRKADLDMKTSVGGSGLQGTRLQLEVLVCEIVDAMAQR
jgi:DNA polymerase III subunit delta